MDFVILGLCKVARDKIHNVNMKPALARMAFGATRDSLLHGLWLITNTNNNLRLVCPERWYCKTVIAHNMYLCVCVCVLP